MKHNSLITAFKSALAFFAKRSRSTLISFFGVWLLCVRIVQRIFRNGTRKQKSNRNLAVIVPKDYKLNAPNYNGAAKDIQSMLEQMSAMGINYEVFLVPRKVNHAIYVLLRRHVGIFRASRILLSIPGSSGLLSLYLRLLGFSNLTFRSHNAELLHRWDWLRCSTSISGILKNMKKLVSGSFSDILVSIFSTRILCVSDKEMKVYWTTLFPWSRKKLEYFPGLSPSNIKKACLSEEFHGQRRIYATIVGGFQHETLISRADGNFIKYGSEIRGYFNSYGLSLVSVGNKVHFDFCDINLGFVPDIDEVLSKTEVIIIPNSSGWGFKTKIADAVTLHQSVVVEERLHSKLGIWGQMVSPLRDWSDISNLKVKTIPPKEYQEFLDYLFHLRAKVLTEMSEK